ncbi:MAG TPA: cyclic pyranopterin monophosphate synthase MoaC [Allosphingosinicella sp.]|uniref:cyclic pyranopterin monophosphate synthase MoaC n=1 Tax=Allosphingosinicella sp. TaxID=2823234 RepID=UPI002EDA80B1
MTELTHFDADGRPHMVDVGGKAATERAAIARGLVRVDAAVLELVRARRAAKGDVLQVAELAGIMGAKRTSDLIPLCHPLPISSVKIEVTIDDVLPGLCVVAEVKTTGRTGVEMEALTAVATACLTIYDMLKGATRDLMVEKVELLEKRGGRSGLWQKPEN